LYPPINILTIIQARLTSTRLPNKVAMSLADKPLLIRLVERVKASPLTGTIVVATTTNESDTPLEKFCQLENIEIFRGHPDDLLDRHYKAALKYEADIVLKIPSDCPLIDPHAITRVIKYFLDNYSKFDYVSNLHPATYPDGNDVEIMRMATLADAWYNAKKNFEREHTTPFIWENRDKFRVGNVEWETGLNYSMTHRFTIDYEEDYLFIKSVYDELFCQNPLFSLGDILSLLDSKPHLMKINAKYRGVNWYRHHLKDLKTITSKQSKII
jgi:spore coat polysaccharide biosynthesis protein SpsF